MNEAMQLKIIEIVKEVSGMSGEPEKINNLISEGYLDSFMILMLINSLESEFHVKFNFDDQLIDCLTSVTKIEKLIESKM